MYDARFQPVSNRADWIQPFEIIDDSTGEVITDLSGVSVIIEVREQGSCYARLSGTTDNGKVTDLGGGVMQWFFPRSEMIGVCPNTYEVGLTFERDDVTTQILIGIVPIVDGIVSR